MSLDFDNIIVKVDNKVVELKTSEVPIMVLPVNWDDIPDKPETFPPEPHDHDERYYTQDELDVSLAGKADTITTTASGSVASFADGAPAPVVDLTASIEPVQDLHGYDYPWPVGGGKNILKYTLDSIKQVNTNGTWSGNAYTYNGVTFTVNSDSEGNVTDINANGTASSSTFAGFIICTYTLGVGTYILSGCPSGGSTNYYLDWRDDANNQKIDGGTGSTITSAGQSGRSVRIVVSKETTITNQKFYPMVRISTDTADFVPSSNICSISGRTGCNITRTGKNLLANSVTYPYTKTGITLTKNQDGSVNISGSNTGSSILYSMALFRGEFLKSLSGKVVVYGGNEQIVNAQLYVTYYRADGSWRSTAHNLNGFVLNVPSDAYTARIQIRIAENANDVDGITLYPQMEFGSTATAYEPYNDETYNVSFDEAGTVYKGILDVPNGVLTVTHGMYTFSGTEQWSQQGTLTKYYSVSHIIRNYGGKMPVSNNVALPLKTSIGYFDRSYNSLHNYPYEMSISYDGRVGIHSSLYSGEGTLAGVQIIFELATPQTYQLTPTEVLTILGQNNIWADTGDSAVTYRADTKLYIDQKIADSATKTRQMIADIANGNLAPKSLASGDLIIVGDELRKATDNIGQGSAITASNSTVATLADVIKTLQQ